MSDTVTISFTIEELSQLQCNLLIAREFFHHQVQEITRAVEFNDEQLTECKQALQVNQELDKKISDIFIQMI